MTQARKAVQIMARKYNGRMEGYEERAERGEGLRQLVKKLARLMLPPHGESPAEGERQAFFWVKPLAALSAQVGPLRRQRGAYIGFDQCDIRRTDCAIGIHVLAEIRARNRLAYLRFGQANIGGIDEGITVHITDEHTHGNGNIAHVCSIVDVKERNRDDLNIGYPSQIDSDL